MSTDASKNKKEHTDYPSRFEIGEECELLFGDDGARIENCKILAVKFYEGKVMYDVEVPVEVSKRDEEYHTMVEKVDSIFVVEPGVDSNY